MAQTMLGHKHIQMDIKKWTKSVRHMCGGPKTMDILSVDIVTVDLTAMHQWVACLERTST